ncbi:uncharacterized protein [Temnothorax longispinosus]|uniref:uncharacterized protein isoform X2 n=1 Tax=Temnothorax longispinosus TaxID=300112 RepID=UPI003A9A4651
MLRLSRESLLPLKEIFDNVSRTNPEVAAHISYSSMKSMMARERIKQRPPIPHTFQALCTDLIKYEWIKEFYKGNVVAQDGSRAVIFSSDKLLEIIQQAQEIFVDGTFSVVPRYPHIDQLYTIHIRYTNKAVGTVFCLCEARISALYEAIWLKILQLAPGLKTSVKFIMSDYEAAAMKVLEKLFPNANIHGCWFHYNQAVLRKWNRLGLTNISSTLLSMTMTLPLLPQEFVQALRILHNYCDATHSKYEELLHFVTYIEKTWLPKASKVSVYNCPVRTNNLVENFHSTMRRKLGPHQNLWIFFDKLTKLLVDQEINFERLQNNKSLTIAQPRKNKERDLKIFQAQTDLITGRLPLEQFLLIFTGIHNNFYLQQDINMQEKENVPNVFLENQNGEKENVPNVFLENQNGEKENVPNIFLENENIEEENVLNISLENENRQEENISNISLENKNGEKENVLNIYLESKSRKNNKEELCSETQFFCQPEHINTKEDGENYERETQVNVNQDPIIIRQPQVVLTRLKRKEYEKYTNTDRQPLASIENTIASKITRRYRRKVHKYCSCCN